jgi:hypothetical protein
MSFHSAVNALIIADPIVSSPRSIGAIIVTRPLAIRCKPSHRYVPNVWANPIIAPGILSKNDAISDGSFCKKFANELIDVLIPLATLVMSDVIPLVIVDRPEKNA